MIRPARNGDVEALVAAYEWLFEPPGAAPPPQAPWWQGDRARRALVEAMAGERSTVLVATGERGELAGFATVYLDLVSVRFGSRAWVEDLAVHPAHRSQGIGTALLDAAKAWAKERGATYLMLSSALGRTDAHRFYEREQGAKAYDFLWWLE